MKTSVWRMLEAVMPQGPAQRNTCDFVMMLNTKFSNDQDQRKFAGFVTGLIKMSCLHIWFSKLKWSMDVLLRFYERHAFICALHKETRLLFDELIFCLQRLYSVPSTLRIDLPFGTDADFTLDDVYNHPIGQIGSTSSHQSTTPTTFASSQASSNGGVMSRSGGFAAFSGGCSNCYHHSHNG